MAEQLTKRLCTLSCENDDNENGQAEHTISENESEDYQNYPAWAGGFEPPSDGPTQEVQWKTVVPFFETSDGHQQEKSREDQVLNSAGGYVYQVSDTMRVRRFLILGVDGGTYYAKEQELKAENADHMVKMIKAEKAMDVLKELHDVNKANCAPKMSPLIFCLATVIRNTPLEDRPTKFRAYQLLPLVCRIPTHLFEFVRYCMGFKLESSPKGWGRSQRRNVANWYLRKGVMQLAMAVTKYQQRAGFSHRDLMRLAHPESSNRRGVSIMQKCAEKVLSGDDPDWNGEYHNDIFLYCTRGIAGLLERHSILTIDVPIKMEEPEEEVDEKKPIIKEIKRLDGITDEQFDMMKKSFEAKQEARKKAKQQVKEKKAAKKAKEAEEKAKHAAEHPEEMKAAVPTGEHRPNPKTIVRKEAKKRQELLIASKRFGNDAPNHLRFFQAVQDLKMCKNENEACEIIQKFGLVREHVPTQLLNSVKIWRHLLQDMPMTAMIRNLGKMTSIGLIQETDNAESAMVCSKLKSVEALKAARVHPFTILLAKAVYTQGRGDKGKLSWKPNAAISQALEDAFYAAFVNVKATGKRFLLALDVSGSMMSPIMGSALSCREASAAMATIALRTEPICEVVAFQDKLTELNFTKDTKLSDIMTQIDCLPFGTTDCSLPMLWAAQQKKFFDCFVVFTDSETYMGDVKADEALRHYRRVSGIPDAKLIVVGMTATEFTIADPEDPNMMDVVGFDSSAPELMRNFVASGFSEIPQETQKPAEGQGDAMDAQWDNALAL